MSDKSRQAERENATGSRGELVELLSDFRTAILVTSREGLPRARPLAIMRVERTGVVWFATADHSPKAAELAIDPNVAVICHRSRDEAWVSITGRADLVRDPAKAKELWCASMK